jgi:hypothetical protein
MQVKESRRSVLEFRADNALCRETKAIPVERNDLSRSSKPIVMTVIRGFMFALPL